jgi:prepilin-type N-terminal cleavage/methylation domain-containing protein
MKMFAHIKKLYFLRDRKSFKAGFTVVEMLVVLAIFAIISSIVISNYSDFRSSVSLENLSQDIALSIRRSQIYAMSVKGTTGVGPTPFPAYGIHFSNESSPSYSYGGSQKSFIIFADLPPSTSPASYDQSSNTCGYSNLATGNECVEEVTINSTDFIKELCVNSTCGLSGSLDISFTRPNSDASFCFILPLGNSCAGSVSSASIFISSLDGKTKKISVWNTGQISIQ